MMTETVGTPAHLGSTLAKLRTQQNSKLENQKQVSVVLISLEEALKSDQQILSPASYLLSLIEQSSVQGGADKGLLYAALYLLDTVLPNVSLPLLKGKFDQIVSLLAPVINNPACDAPMLRSAIGALDTLLVVQDTAAWQGDKSPARLTFAALVALAMDQRPKVRKRALDAVQNVLGHPPAGLALAHPGLKTASSTALNVVGVCMHAASKGNKKSHSSFDSSKLIHSLHLIKTIIQANGWPTDQFAAISDLLLKLPSLRLGFVSVAVFQVFDTLFSTAGQDYDAERIVTMVKALQDMRPSEKDLQVVPAWIKVTASGLIALADMDHSQAEQLAHTILTYLHSLLASEIPEISRVTGDAVVTLCESSLFQNADPKMQSTQDTIETILSGIGNIKFFGSREQSMEICLALVRSLGESGADLMIPYVKIIGDIRSQPEFEYRQQADRAISAAVRVYGPERVLSVLPLNILDTNTVKRAWMLPILRENITNTYFNHFVQEFLPLSEAVYQKIIDRGQGEKDIGTKAHEIVIEQIWSLLPGYFDIPRDLQSSFRKEIAELLANVLYKQVELRPMICQALQRLVDCQSELIKSESSDEELKRLYSLDRTDVRSNLDFLAGFAPNMVSVLFNIISQTVPAHRGFLFETTRSWMLIMSDKDVAATFDRVQNLLSQSLSAHKEPQKISQDEIPPMVYTLLDILNLLQERLQREPLQQIYGMILKLIESEDSVLQKKSYRLLGSMIDSTEGRSFLTERVVELEDMFCKTSSSVPIAVKKERIGAVNQLLDIIPNTDLHIVPILLPEWVLSTKEINEKTRIDAFELLVKVGDKMKQGGTISASKLNEGESEMTTDQDATIQEYFTMVAAGLAGQSPHMMSATIGALSRLLFSFKDDLQDTYIEDLLSTLDMFVVSKNREIAKAALGFEKVACLILDKTVIQRRLSVMIPNLLVWSHEHKGHFKSKVKHLLERLIKKFGFEAINVHVPEGDRKLMTNIRKSSERQKRNAEVKVDSLDNERPTDRKPRYATAYDEALYGSESDDESGDESDESELGDTKRGRDTKRKGQQAFIQERGDEPMDLLNRSSLSNVSSTNPQVTRALAEKRRNRTEADKNAFKTSQDGKMVIRDEDESSDDEPSKSADKSVKGNAYMGILKNKDSYRRGQNNRVKFSNKRRRDDDEDEDDDTGVDKERVGQQHIKRQSHGHQGSRNKRRGSFKKH